MVYLLHMDDTKPNPDVMSIDDLLNVATNDSTDTIDLHDDLKDINQMEIRSFIRAKNIVKHTKPVPVKLIYDTYLLWGENPLGPNMFIRYFKQYFDIHMYLGVHCFKINPESIGLPDYYSVYRDIRFNTKKRKTKHFGVYPVASYYIARLQLEDNMYYIGKFETAEEAAVAYDIEAYFHFGKFAKLNYIGRTVEYEEEIKKRKG